MDRNRESQTKKDKQSLLSNCYKQIKMRTSVKNKS